MLPRCSFHVKIGNSCVMECRRMDFFGKFCRRRDLVGWMNHDSVACAGFVVSEVDFILHCVWNIKIIFSTGWSKGEVVVFLGPMRDFEWILLRVWTYSWTFFLIRLLRKLHPQNNHRIQGYNLSIVTCKS